MSAPALSIPPVPAFGHLDRLESEAIHIIREVAAEFRNPVMLYSIGKDSAVMLHLAMKAFAPGVPPFPLLHVDTTWKFRDMIAFRDRIAKEYGLELLVHTNPEGVAKGVNPFDFGSKVHTDIMKTEALKQALNAGGLYVLATERHESRRIDNQLRGRSGRQGDPGRSSFFLSLEDDLMRIFGSERIDGMLQKLGLEDGEAIIHPWVNKAIEKAQGKVEAVIVGADRITANGDTANKIGTSLKAYAARHHGVPFHVAIPASTYDVDCQTGDAIPIEERDVGEVLVVNDRPVTAPQTTARNWGFDVTPADLVTSWITDRGVLTRTELPQLGGAAAGSVDG